MVKSKGDPANISDAIYNLQPEYLSEWVYVQAGPVSHISGTVLLSRSDPHAEYLCYISAEDIWKYPEISSFAMFVPIRKLQETSLYILYPADTQHLDVESTLF